MVKVLISDKMAPRAAEIFRERGIEVDERPGIGKTPEELAKIIGDYDGLAIRSSTTVTDELLAHATNLKVIGRAGIGTDNIDKVAATQRGIIVMNTPFGNSITTAEQTIAMLMAMARKIPQANTSTHAGKWEKSKFMGVEIFNKTLGVIGCGNIGAIVIDRAQGLKMRVIGYDPYLTDERAVELGIEKVDLDTLYKRADFITLHVPKTEDTADMINAAAIAKMKDGVHLLNVARGGLINEADLLAALDSGKVAGAALDVFVVEPATENPLFNHDNVICTPHLGASTTEAQDKVAVQVAEQIAEYLLHGAVENALNMPSISAEDAPKLKPYLKLAEQMGLMMGQIVDGAIQSITIEYSGDVSKLNNKPLTSVLIASVLKHSMEDVNMVSAPSIAKSRGIEISTTYKDSAKNFQDAVRLIVRTENEEREITGVLFGDGNPRIVSLDNISIEAKISPFMVFIRNIDKPGLIGSVGTILGQANINIADFHLDKIHGEPEAIALIAIDSELPNAVREELQKNESIKQIIILRF